MKYLWLILGFVFVGIVAYELIAKGSWDGLNALWGLVCWLQYDVKDLQDKIKKLP